MKSVGRGIAWVLLVAVVPVAMFAVVLALIAFNVYAFVVSPVTAVKIAAGVVPTVLVLGRGLWILVARDDSPVDGVPVREHEQPQLWALVRRLAEVAGTAPPHDIHVVADANAAVMEDTRLLGLISTRRRMFIGAPLLTELSAPRFAAVLTHELAHYSNRDTRFAGIAYRSRRAFVHTLNTLDRDDHLQRALHFLLRRSGTLTLKASATLARRQESAADAAAAAAVGSAATVGALRELAPIAWSWSRFRDNHLIAGCPAGYLPADPFGGYRRLRASLPDEQDRLRAEPPDDADPYDTHPPMRARIAAVGALRAAGTVHVPPGPALGLLRDPAPLLDAALLDGLVPEARTMRRADWPTLIRIGGLASMTEHTDRVLAGASRLTGRPPSLRTLLDALDAGLMTGIGADPAAPDRPSDGPRVRAERSRLIVRDGLRGAVVATLTEIGAVRWQEAWPSVGALQADGRLLDHLPDLVEAAVSDRPDTRGLRTLLDSAVRQHGRHRRGTATGDEDQGPDGHAQGGQAPGTVGQALHRGGVRR